MTTSPVHGRGRPARRPSVSVVVPTLNEERNLPAVFARIPADVEVILVDGGSVDRTVEVARELRPSIVITQQTRAGKGNALACGFAEARGDIIVMIDADGSTDPGEIDRFVAAVHGGADFAKGSRFREGGDSYDITPLRRLGNRGLNGLVNTLFGTRFTDLCYGYNAFHRSVLDHLDLPSIDAPAPAGGRLWGDGFEIETLINIRVAAAGLRVTEVPSVEAPRQYGESNLNTFRDGMRVLRTIVSEYRRNAKRSRVATPAPVEAPVPLPVRPAGAAEPAGERRAA
ncbi:glycosyltransferase family 2 protein [Phytohabitans sp. ZYX-F-186]|uniref:Glycosyltransferase family 2 protein n=1 Tax=Phytohabitans maris TaxID=3071409 RepID=A0ABU0ZHA1_9ACTN|nr:glycosyltransferase family 2 protein [Phytohabitans sp. ZYX-F-186]MDQ7905784.1 glycosyltransferase family 2 protein [Phytohabitans sp. ZYX-F-186]